MVGSIESSNNLINMISKSFQQERAVFRIPEGQGGPPPPLKPGIGDPGKDPLGVFDTVDSDSDSSISESEFNTLSEGILEVTGSELNGSFLDFDLDVVQQLLEDANYTVTRDLIATAMKKTDRYERTVRNMVKEVMEKKRD